MKCERNAYHPTLWRTCRALANAKRLACLRVVLSRPAACVGEIAEQLHIPVNQASMCLRAIQARGLIRAYRESRWVRYTPCPDPLVPCSRPLLKALRIALLDERHSEVEIMRTLTGFTHPRRLVLLRHFQMSRASFTVDTLAAATRISLPAIKRHLRKLSARSLVRCRADEEWILAKPQDALSRALLRLLQTADKSSHGLGAPRERSVYDS